MSTNHAFEKAINRQCLMKIAENIRFLARQGLSFLLATDVVIVSPGLKIGRTGYFLAATALVSVLWNKFSEICNHCLKMIPSKWGPSKHNQPWITRYIKQITRKNNCARLTNYAKDWSTYLDLKRISQ